MLTYVSHAAHPSTLASVGTSVSPLIGVQTRATAESMPRLIVTKITLRRDSRHVIGQISIANTGTGDADNVHLTLVNLAGVAACTLPSGVTLEAGQVTTISLIFPNALPGMQRLYLIGGCAIGSSAVPGSFISNQRVTVP